MTPRWTPERRKKRPKTRTRAPGRMTKATMTKGTRTKVERTKGTRTKGTMKKVEGTKSARTTRSWHRRPLRRWWTPRARMTRRFRRMPRSAPRRRWQRRKMRCLARRGTKRSPARWRTRYPGMRKTRRLLPVRPRPSAAHRSGPGTAGHSPSPPAPDPAQQEPGSWVPFHRRNPATHNAAEAAVPRRKSASKSAPEATPVAKPPTNTGRPWTATSAGTMR